MLSSHYEFFDNGGDGVIVGTDDFAMRQGFTLGESSRLGFDALVVLQGTLQLTL
jgi:hypothetical protein